jgi:hypothetical protein
VGCCGPYRRVEIISYDGGDELTALLVGEAASDRQQLKADVLRLTLRVGFYKYP